MTRSAVFALAAAPLLVTRRRPKRPRRRRSTWAKTIRRRPMILRRATARRRRRAMHAESSRNADARRARRATSSIRRAPRSASRSAKRRWASRAPPPRDARRGSRASSGRVTRSATSPAPHARKRAPAIACRSPRKAARRSRTSRCAPHDPLSCGGKTNAGTGVCFVSNDGTTDCQEGGSRTENQTCSPTDDCGPGLVCITPSTGSDSCKRWCRVGMSDCGGSAVCRGFSTKVMVGTVEYGACP